METLVRFVHDREMLIVLDNCEHLLDATASLVTEILGACPQLRILATSREPVNVAGEVIFLVPSLSLADEAVELFADRARRVRPEFTVTEDNVAAVTEICTRLDGMPLAIELAAARVRALSLDEIVRSLHDRFRLLTGGSRTAVRRQQTLRASVDWSHALLTEPERVLFRRLAAFLGGFDLDAAQAVAGDAEVERYQILDQLALLVDKSLVVAENASGRTRYRLLETVRQYAQEKLGESGEAGAVRQRHRDHYTSMAALLDAPARTDYHKRIEQADDEMENLRSAFGWSAENGDIARALELASSLLPLWLSRGRIQEGRAWFDAVLADNSIQDNIQAAVRARVLADKAVLDAWANIYSTADAEQALVIARELDDPALLARVLTACGSASVYDTEVATRYFDEAIGLARAIEDPWRLSQILGQQAQVAFVAGEPIAARAAAEEGRDLADAIGDRFGSRQCRWRIGGALAMQGELSESIAELRAMVAEAEADHDVMSRVTGLFVLQNPLAYHGDVGEARVIAEQAIASAAELGDVYIGASYIALMIANLAAGDVAQASEVAEVAWSHMGALYGTASLNNVYIAQVDLARGDLAAARRRADDAVVATTGWLRAAAHTVRAHIAIADCEPERAEQNARSALACCASFRAYLAVPEVLEILGSLAGDADRHQESARLFGAADGIRQRTGEVRFPMFEAGYEAAVAAVRNTMEDRDFEAAWAEGSAMSTEEAIAYAQRGRGERKRPAKGWESLTPTERDVVRLVGEGLANKDVAARLFVSPRTVESHLSHVYTKLGLSSRVQLAQEAARRQDA
jgi:predicted ATPase/DNA-binding CsgD family transcriptional regulator